MATRATPSSQEDSPSAETSAAMSTPAISASSSKVLKISVSG